MKLLAVSLPRHDGNISYFDGHQLKYIKLERIKQEKRYTIKNKWDWIYEIKNLWNINLEEIDDIIFDFHAETFYDLNKLPKEVYDVLSGKLNAVSIKKCNVFSDYIRNPRVWYISHHYAHSLSSWMLTNREPDLNIVIDGVGDHRTWSVFKKDKLVDRGNPGNGSIGGLIGRAATYLDVEGYYNSDKAGKFMGLQCYGNLDEDYLQKLRTFNLENINNVFDLDEWFKHKNDKLLGRLNIIDWARTIHERTGEIVLELFAKHANQTDLITYSGGVAQNVIWNTKIKQVYKNLIIPPHSGDEGLSLGSIEWLRRKYKLPKFKLENFPYCQNDFAPSENPSMDLIKKVAKLLSEGKVVGWYQGNGEVGPRALGNRSILFNPSIKNGKDIVNNIKRRENYRPFGASVLKEHANKYFDCFDDNYMLYTAKMKFDGLDAIKHVDGTCRVQTVGDNNIHFRLLLEEFYKITNLPVLLNTSLNLGGKPLAGYPEIAKDIFQNTSIDCVVIGNKLLQK